MTVIRAWKWLGITFPLLDFTLGALGGLLYVWINGPGDGHYLIPAWLGFGLSFVGVGFFFRLLHSAAERL